MVRRRPKHGVNLAMLAGDDKSPAGLLVLTVLMLGVLLPCGRAPAQTPDAGFRYEKDAFRHVAEELQKRRVVALADFGHGNAYPYHTLLQVLSNWLDLATPAGGRLVLAMEMDDESTRVLRDYLRTGDLTPVLAYWLPFSTLDQLAFYRDLREFVLRIHRLNEDRAEDRRIDFHVQGLETISMWTAGSAGPDVLPDVAQAGETANARDRGIASTLLACLKEHPRDHALVFYGMDHLCIRETNASWAARLFRSSRSWQPMGFLMKQELGKDLLSIGQSPLPPAAGGGAYREMIGHDIFMRSAEVPWKLNRIDPADFDAVVFPRVRTIDEGHQVRYICCRHVLEQAIAKLARIETLPQNAFTAKYPVPARVNAGLRFITGQSFTTAEQWRQWADAHPYDGFAQIDSNDFAEAIRRACCQPMNRQRSAMLGSLGLPPAYFGRQHRISPEQWRRVWPKLATRVRFLQWLGIYWIGHPDERDKARARIVEFSGQEYDGPADYLKWYRSTCLYLNY